MELCVTKEIKDIIANYLSDHKLCQVYDTEELQEYNVQINRGFPNRLTREIQGKGRCLLC